MSFNIKDLKRSDLHFVEVDMEHQFSPQRTDFYSYAAARGCGVCPTLVPSFTIALDSDNTAVAIETHIDTYWGFKEGISQNIPEQIPSIFAQYMRDKGYSDDIFNIDSPEKAALFLGAYKDIQLCK